MTTWLLLVALLALLLTGCVDVRVNYAVVPPPPGWGDLGLHPGWRVQEYDNLKELQAFCAEYGAPAAPRTSRDAYTQACAVGGPHKVIAVPSKKAWPSGKEIQQMRTHEEAHSWGLVHGDDQVKSREQWLYHGAPAQPLSTEEVQRMLEAARAAQATQRQALDDLQRRQGAR